MQQQAKFIVDYDRVCTMLDAYERLFGHFDAIFSICRVRRYHLKEGMLPALRIQIKQACALWRSLDLSVTPKMHCLEDHFAHIVESFEGVGDLGEDEGERGHQTGHKHELRTCSLRDRKKKAHSIAATEAMQRNDDVREHQSRVAVETKRNSKRKGDSLGEINARNAKVARELVRGELMRMPIHQTPIVLIRMLRKDALKRMHEIVPQLPDN